MRDLQDHTKAMVLAFQNGKEAAFDFLFRQYYAPLCFFAFSILQNDEEAKDIVQDSFVKLWNTPGWSKRSDSVKSFLYTIVRNACVDSLRKAKTRQRATQQFEDSDSETEFDYFDEVVFSELVRQVRDYISELPQSTQNVIQLYYVDGKTYNEIADNLNSTPEAIRKQKSRALDSIRRKFLSFLIFF